MSILTIQKMSIHNFIQVKVYRVPNDSSGSEEARNELLSLVEIIERCREFVDEIGNIYNMFCDIYHNELNKWF